MVRYILKQQRQRNNNCNGKHSVQSKIVKENITTFHNICTIVLVYFCLFKFCKGLHVDLCIFINFIVSLFSTLFQFVKLSLIILRGCIFSFELILVFQDGAVHTGFCANRWIQVDTV